MHELTHHDEEAGVNPDMMTLDECRDALARFNGHTLLDRTPDGDWWKDPSGNKWGVHPILPDLDLIAGALPIGWGWEHIDFATKVNAVAIHIDTSLTVSGFNESELLARARCAVKAWMTEGKVQA